MSPDSSTPTDETQEHIECATCRQLAQDARLVNVNLHGGLMYAACGEDKDQRIILYRTAIKSALQGVANLWRVARGKPKRHTSAEIAAAMLGQEGDQDEA